MSQTKVQLIAPIGVVTASTLETTGVLTATTFVGDIAGTVTGITSTTDNLDVGIVTATAFVGDFTGTASSIVTGSNVTAGIITGTKFVGNATGTVSGLADDTNINVGILTSTSFVGDLTGNAAGLSTTNANLSLGIVTATSFAGNITGNAAGISVTTTNANLGIITASAFHGDGANLSGVSAGPVSQQAVTANGANTSIDLSSGNVIYMTQTADTTVAFASTEGNTDTVYLIRIPDGTARTLTWPSGLVWNGGSEPNLASGASDYQVFKLTTRDNGATWYGSIGAEDTPIREYWTWGSNDNGNLGVNSRTSYSSPVQVPGTTWSRLGRTGSDGSNAAVKNDGTLWMMGYNGQGQIGDNSTTQRSSPVQIPGTTWSNYVVTWTKTFATKTDGTLWVWGTGGEGGLAQNNRTQYSSPVQIPGTDWDTGDFKIGVSNVGGYAIKTNGELWSWGYNQYGELGQNSVNTGGVSSPVQVPGTTWRHVSTTNGAVMATKTDGTLWAWGANQTGMLGLNAPEISRKSSPTQIPGTTWYAPFMMWGASAGVKTDGTLWSWGYNMPGHLGQNNRTEYSSPVQVGTDTTWNKDKVRFGGGTLGGIKTDGTLWVIGRNTKGQLGQNNNTRYSSPVQVPGNYSDLGGFGWYSISALRKPTLN